MGGKAPEVYESLMESGENYNFATKVKVINILP